jgi:tetratricopeptide (TPR) repeat protein
VDVLGWLLVVVVLVALAIAPAFPRVRLALGASRDSEDARAVRRAMRRPLRDRTTPAGASTWADEAGTGHGRGEPANRAPFARNPAAALASYPRHVESLAGTVMPAVEKEEDVLLRSVEGFEAVGRKWQAANAYNLLGFVHERHAEFPEAITAHERALETFQGLSDEVGIGDSLNNVAVVTARTGRSSEAVRLHEEALALRIGMPLREANSYNNLGVALALADRDAAVANFRSALDIAQKCGDERGAGKAVNNIAAVKLSRLSMDAALRELERARALRAAAHDVRGEAKTHNNLGVACALAGRFAEAFQRFMTAASLAAEVDDRLALVHILLNAQRLGPAGVASDEIASLGTRLRTAKSELSEASLRQTADSEAVTHPCSELGGMPLVALLSSGSMSPETTLSVLTEQVAQH